MNDPATADGWHPRHPDPALADPRPPGLRPHRHPPNRLHAWVFGPRGAQVWVDGYGNQREIDVLPPDYASNIVTFCQQQAARIRVLVTIDRLEQAVRLGLDGDHAAADTIVDEVLADAALTSEEFLERTPLFRALRRRLDQRPPKATR